MALDSIASVEGVGSSDISHVNVRVFGKLLVGAVPVGNGEAVAKGGGPFAGA